MTTLNINRENMISSTEIVRNFSNVLNRSKESPIYIMRNNDIEGVILNIEAYEELLEKIETMEKLINKE